MFQSFLSLLKQPDAEDGHQLRGIQIPGPLGEGKVELRAQAFADDLVAFLRNENELPYFKKKLTTYEKGSRHAKNSWPKTEGLRIGSLADSTHLPDGWDPTHISWPTAVKSLGIPSGDDDRVKDMWDQKTTKAITGCFTNWRTRSMPKTGYGRTLVIKSSAMSRAWYLVSNGTPPDSKSLDEYMAEWRQHAWDFYYESFWTPGVRGHAIAVKQQTLVQDHADGGQRALCIESFVRALYARWGRRLLRPTPMPWKNIAWACINAEYGFLQQGSRLLLSNCDFLRLRGRAPAFIANALIAHGAMPCVVPAVDQTDMDPTAAYFGSHTSAQRTVNANATSSGVETLAEPFPGYNANIPGRWGSMASNPPGFASRRDPSKPQLIRVSPEREAEAELIYNKLKALAHAGFTHLVHWTTGHEPGESIAVITYDEFCAKARGPRRRGDVPLQRSEFDRLMAAIPEEWHADLDAIRALQQSEPATPLRDLLGRLERKPNTWVQYELDGETLVGQVDALQQITNLHFVDPRQVLQAKTGVLPIAASSPSVQTAVVWSEERLAHSLIEDESRDRQVLAGRKAFP